VHNPTEDIRISRFHALQYAKVFVECVHLGLWMIAIVVFHERLLKPAVRELDLACWWSGRHVKLLGNSQGELTKRQRMDEQQGEASCLAGPMEIVQLAESSCAFWWVLHT